MIRSIQPIISAILASLAVSMGAPGVAAAGPTIRVQLPKVVVHHRSPPITVAVRPLRPTTHHRWVEGHYELRNHHPVWIPGHWVAPPPHHPKPKSITLVHATPHHAHRVTVRR